MSNLEGLQQQREHTQARLLEIVREIVDVIASDVPAFFLRAARDVFVASETGDELDDDALAAFKQSIRQAGETAAKEVRDSLENDDLWTSEDLPVVPGKSLEPHELVWPRLDALAEHAAQAVVDGGIAEDAEDVDVVYQTPTWFIDGKDAPGLIEKYWQHLSRLRELESQVDDAQTEARKETRAERWDAID